MNWYFTPGSLQLQHLLPPRKPNPFTRKSPPPGHSLPSLYSTPTTFFIWLRPTPTHPSHLSSRTTQIESTSFDRHTRCAPFLWYALLLLLLAKKIQVLPAVVLRRTRHGPRSPASACHGRAPGRTDKVSGARSGGIDSKSRRPHGGAIPTG